MGHTLFIHNHKNSSVFVEQQRNISISLDYSNELLEQFSVHCRFSLQN